MIGARSRASLCALVVVIPLLLAQSAAAATVQCGTGDAPCLIAAINQANAQPQVKTTIRLAGGTYALSAVDNLIDGPNGLPSIVSMLTLEAPLGTVITRDTTKGALNFRLLQVAATGNLTINGLSFVGGMGAILNRGTVILANSRVEGSSQTPIGTGAIVNNGTLTIMDTTFMNDVGAVTNAGTLTMVRTQMLQAAQDRFGPTLTSSGSLTLSQSVMTGSVGSLGPTIGVYVKGGTALITQTTFTKNLADGVSVMRVAASAKVVVRDSAFVNNDQAIDSITVFNEGTLEVTNSTFTGNTFPQNGQVIFNSGSLAIRSSTFAGNTGAKAPECCSEVLVNAGATAVATMENTILMGGTLNSSCYGSITSLGHNIFSDGSCTAHPTDLVVGDAGLGTLIDDGTPGNAHLPLLPDSPAINAAVDCPRTDQLGQWRYPSCDIGAVEFLPYILQWQKLIALISSLYL